MLRLGPAPSEKNYLNFNVGEIITVLDKHANDKIWTGCLNSGQVLFI